jgi:hypothetical protein
MQIGQQASGSIFFKIDFSSKYQSKGFNGSVAILEPLDVDVDLTMLSKHLRWAKEFCCCCDSQSCALVSGMYPQLSQYSAVFIIRQPQLTQSRCSSDDTSARRGFRFGLVDAVRPYFLAISFCKAAASTVLPRAGPASLAVTELCLLGNLAEEFILHSRDYFTTLDE